MTKEHDQPHTCAVLIVAAGRGQRAGDGPPKQYRVMAGKSVLRRTLEAFSGHPDIGDILVVIHPDDRPLYDKSTVGLNLRAPVSGGETRQQSVFRGLTELAGPGVPDVVLVHDAARCFVNDAVISRVIAKVRQTGDGAIAALPVVDTLKKGVTSVEATVERDNLWRAQTPQGFPFPALLAAHQAASGQGQALTDDASVAEAAGITVHLVQGDESNIKLTTEADFERVEKMNKSVPEYRTGQGFDVHRFEPGDHLWLCGVKIPHAMGLQGHSDADVALHALTDALLGTVAAGDIGDHFPPGDARWKGAASDQFIGHALSLVQAAGGALTHVDLTLICEAPKIGPHKAAMRDHLAALLGLSRDRVSVKATTTERLGFTGRGEGIAAQALVTVAFIENGETP